MNHRRTAPPAAYKSKPPLAEPPSPAPDTALARRFLNRLPALFRDFPVPLGARFEITQALIDAYRGMGEADPSTDEPATLYALREIDLLCSQRQAKETTQRRAARR